MTDRTRLDHLSSCYGIALEYTDIWGRSHPTSAATQRALLAAMGVPAKTEVDLECRLESVNPGIRGHHTYLL